MKAGELREAITFYTQTSEADAYGDAVVSYVAGLHTRAKVEFGKSWRSVVNDEVVYNRACYFTIYNHFNISEYSLIKWKGDYYRITSIGEFPQEQKYDITAEKIDPTSVLIDE